jgi:hypothetical protein
VKKNYLILINYSEKLPYFLKQLSEVIKSEGHNCFFAVDSNFTNDIHFSGNEVDIFENHFSYSKKCDSDILGKYGNYPLNKALLSDYERAEVFGFGGDRNDEYYQQLQSSLLSFFESLIVKHNVDYIIYENISNSFAYFASFVGHKLNVPYLGVTSSRLPGYFVTDSYMDYESKKIQGLFNNLVLNDETEREYVDRYLENIDNIVPDGIVGGNHSNLSLISRYFNKRKFLSLLMSTKYIFSNNNYSYLIGSPFLLLMNSFKRSLCRKIKAKLLVKIYHNQLPNKPYFLYPLQFHPESSTSVRASDFLSELEVIKNIAFNLPCDTFLFVKDHPSSFGYPSISFYKQIARLPNVCLVNPFHDTKALIKSSSGVVTLSSTVGYEALLLSKRVLLFGSVFYDFHRNVTKFTTYEHVKGILMSFKAGENGEPDSSIYEYNRKFVAAYMRSSYKGVLNFDTSSKEFNLFCKLSYDALKDSLSKFKYD